MGNTYNPGIYHEQGGSTLVVGSTSTIRLEGVLSTTGGGVIKDSITIASTVAAVTARGTIVVSSTNSTGVGAYNLAAPEAAGIGIDILCQTSTGGVTLTSTGATISMNTTTPGSVLTFLGSNTMCHLRSLSATAWHGIRSSTDVTST